jgi:outer membrane protein TolC
MRTTRCFLGAVLFVVLCLPVFAADAPGLSLDGFLSQVTASGPGYQAASKAVEGLGKQKSQTDLLYSPHLKAKAGRQNDRRDSVLNLGSSTIPVHKLVGDDYSVGVEKVWKYGVITSVGYDWQRFNLNDGYVGYLTSPKASVVLPLWRDFLGRQTRAQMDKIKFEIESGEFAAAHQRDAVLFQARNAYWGLQLAREEVSIRKDTLARSETLVAWAKRRVNLRLADDSEALQARAMKQVRELELEQAVENERAARVAFNRLRGKEGEEVQETLDGLNPQVAVLSFQWPQEAPKRWDVRGAESKIKADKAAWVDAKANAWPDLKVFASYTANGMGGTFSDSHQQSLDDHHPTGMVGASIDIPLDVFTAKKSADGYALNYQASKASFDDKTLAARQDWLQLKNRLEDVNRRLVLVTEIEKIQKSKAETERRQLSLGRSTQFQVQSYETEYALSRLQCLGVAAQKLSVWAEGEWMLSADKETKTKQ